MYCVDLPIQINKQNKICTEKCIMGNEKLRGGKKDGCVLSSSMLFDSLQAVSKCFKDIITGD